jgi:predicted nucleic acid-binding protein
MPFSALLDTSVLFPALLRDTLLRVAAQDTYRPLWSSDILEELRRSLRERYPMDPPDVERVVSFMTEHFPDSLVGDYGNLIKRIDLSDPDDRHVVAAAIAGRADVIVTANEGDFRSVEQTYGIEVQTPDTFLTERLAENPKAIAVALREQVTAYQRPPQSVKELISALGLADFAVAITALDL